MNISIVSGKGGAGKTLVSTALANSLEDCVYIDADVEEPNGHLLLDPQKMQEQDFLVEYPKIDETQCIFCMECVKNCQFNSILLIPDNKKVIFFEKMCHRCGVCSYVCPEKNVISKQEIKTGIILKGTFGTKGKINFIDGVLNIGEMSAISLIEGLFDQSVSATTRIIDSPPGTSCSAVAVLEITDLCVIVCEPTPFGKHDFELTLELVQQMGIDYRIILNKVTENKITEELREKYGDRILGEIPLDKKIAENYSNAGLVSSISTELNGVIEDISAQLMKRIEEYEKN